MTADDGGVRPRRVVLGLALVALVFLALGLGPDALALLALVPLFVGCYLLKVEQRRLQREYEEGR